jgi:hypothetical protein
MLSNQFARLEGLPGEHVEGEVDCSQDDQPQHGYHDHGHPQHILDLLPRVPPVDAGHVVEEVVLVPGHPGDLPFDHLVVVEVG